MNKSLALVRVADGVAHATAPVNLNGDLLRAHMVEPLGEQAQLAAPTHQELMATTKQRRRRRSTRPPDATTCKYNTSLPVQSGRSCHYRRNSDSTIFPYS